MSNAKTAKLGKRGVVVIPKSLQRRYGMEEGSLVIIEEKEEGLLIRRAVALPVETYTPERRAEFLLSNAVDQKDYARAKRRVREMGLDPENIPHRGPSED